MQRQCACMLGAFPRAKACSSLRSLLSLFLRGGKAVELMKWPDRLCVYCMRGESNKWGDTWISAFYWREGESIGKSSFSIPPLFHPLPFPSSFSASVCTFSCSSPSLPSPPHYFLTNQPLLSSSSSSPSFSLPTSVWFSTLAHGAEFDSIKFEIPKFYLARVLF